MESGTLRLSLAQRSEHRSRDRRQTGLRGRCPIVGRVLAVIQALRHPGAVNALPGMHVRRVIANGESQSANRMTTYYNSINSLYHLADGIVFYDSAGTLRTDQPTKAISVATEIGIGINTPSGVPAPDSTNYRRWEVAGTSHVSLYDMQYADAITGRDGYLKLPDGTPTDLTGLITGCADYPCGVPCRHTR